MLSFSLLNPIVHVSTLAVAHYNVQIPIFSEGVLIGHDIGMAELLHESHLIFHIFAVLFLNIHYSDTLNGVFLLVLLALDQVHLPE